MREALVKRTQYLVDPSYQLRFATRLFAIILGVAILSWFLAVWVLQLNLYQPTTGSQTTVLVASIAVTTTLGVQLLLAIPIVFYLGVRQTHHVVGPIERMKRALKAIEEGDFSQRIKLRKGDALPDLADAINRMAESLQRGPSKPSGS